MKIMLLGNAVSYKSVLFRYVEIKQLCVYLRKECL